MRESINCLNQLINNNTFYFEVIMLVTTIIIIPYIIRLTSVNHKLRTYSRIIIIQKLVQYIESSIFHKKELDELFFILKKGELIASAKFNTNSFESYFNKQKVRNRNYKRTELEQEVNLLKDLSGVPNFT